MSTNAEPPPASPPEPAARRRPGKRENQAQANGSSDTVKLRSGRLREAELEVALRASEERYRAMVEDSTEVIIRLAMSSLITP